MALEIINYVVEGGLEIPVGAKRLTSGEEASFQLPGGRRVVFTATNPDNTGLAGTAWYEGRDGKSDELYEMLLGKESHIIATEPNGTRFAEISAVQ